MSEPETNRQLPDGTRLLVREVRPDDRALLELGFQHFGSESRYRRFLQPKNALTEHDLRYLTEVDGRDHIAIGTIMFDAQGVAQPVGIARLVRLAPGGEIAEPAVAVVDEMQGKGVGKLLLRELSDRAYACGVRRFRCSVLSSNTPVRALLHELDSKVHLVSSDAGVDTLELELPAPQIADNGDAPRKRLEQLLRLVASKLVSWVPPKISH